MLRPMLAEPQPLPHEHCLVRISPLLARKCTLTCSTAIMSVVATPTATAAVLAIVVAAIAVAVKLPQQVLGPILQEAALMTQQLER